MVYYADGPSADVPEDDPTDVDMMEDIDKQRGSNRVASIESFYDDETEEATNDNDRTETGAGIGTKDANTEIKSYYVN